MFDKKSFAFGGASLVALFLAVAPASAQWGPGQQGPNWDRGGPSSYSSRSTYQTVQPTYVAPTASQSFYSAQGQSNRSVLIQISVPENAKIWFGDTATMQSGSNRQFVSPPLSQGENYVYKVRVEWNDNGQTKDQTRNVTVRAGDKLNLEFGQK